MPSRAPPPDPLPPKPCPRVSNPRPQGMRRLLELLSRKRTFLDTGVHSTDMPAAAAASLSLFHRGVQACLRVSAGVFLAEQRNRRRQHPILEHLSSRKNERLELRRLVQAGELDRAIALLRRG